MVVENMAQKFTKIYVGIRGKNMTPLRNGSVDDFILLNLMASLFDNINEKSFTIQLLHVTSIGKFYSL